MTLFGWSKESTAHLKDDQIAFLSMGEDQLFLDN